MDQLRPGRAMEVEEKDATTQLIEFFHLNPLVVGIARDFLFARREATDYKCADLKGNQGDPIALVGNYEREYGRDKEIVKTGNGYEGDKGRLPDSVMEGSEHHDQQIDKPDGGDGKMKPKCECSQRSESDTANCALRQQQYPRSPLSQGNGHCEPCGHPVRPILDSSKRRDKE